ncbi:hypothetical protein AVEN_59184-1 [Araneus ventricosus]|uniref:Uncharacterized protein n=1 Tax=Araneus ventricosus TaxID=182803 RepID=A0A4Y2UPP7_ARAVE|nr:hypothetical protein AVEN_59184-1 [Araneus ventricosus]
MVAVVYAQRRTYDDFYGENIYVQRGHGNRIGYGSYGSGYGGNFGVYRDAPYNSGYGNRYDGHGGSGSYGYYGSRGVISKSYASFQVCFSSLNTPALT